MNKKTAVLITAAALMLTLSSCSEKNASDTETASEETAAVTEQNEAVSETAAETEEEADELIYDFTGLDSEKYITALTSEKYHMTFTCDYEGLEMKRDIYFDTCDYVLDRTVYMNVDYSTIYITGIKYNVIDDIYFASEPGDEDDQTENYLFKGYGYTESGKTEYDGKTYRYDEFSQGSDDSVMKLLLNDDGTLFAIVTDDTVMYTEVCDTDFVTSETVKLPDNASEVTDEDFNTYFMNAVLSGTDLLEDNLENDSADEPANTENTEAEAE